MIAEYADAVTRPLRELKVKVLLEPGRSIIGPSGALLTTVLYRKTNGGKKFVVVDAAMNDLIRPALVSGGASDRSGRGRQGRAGDCGHCWAGV